MTRQHTLLFVLPLIIAMLGFPPCAEADVRVENLRCEYMHNPIGVESKQPRLSWTLASEQRRAADSLSSARGLCLETIA